MTTQTESFPVVFHTQASNSGYEWITCPYAGVFFIQQMDHWLLKKRISYRVAGEGWIMSAADATYFLTRWSGLDQSTILKKIQEQGYQKD